MRTKRWKPTMAALKIIRECALRVSETKRIKIEIAERQSIVTGERAMDIRWLTREHAEHDLSCCYDIKALRTGKLHGEMTKNPIVELWVYAVDREGWVDDLQDQIIVEFDEAGDVVYVNRTYVNGATMYMKGMKR